MKRFHEITQRGFPYLVATVVSATTGAPEVVGYAYANRFSGHQFTAEDSIYLCNEHTGKGIGSELLWNLLVSLKALGWVRQVVSVLATEDDNPASIKLHASFGFRKVAHFTKVGFKFDRFIDRVNMQLDINKAMFFFSDPAPTTSSPSST